MRISDTGKKLLHSHRRSGRSVLCRRMADQNRHLPAAKCTGLADRPYRSWGCDYSDISDSQALQGYPLLVMRRLFTRTEDC